MTVREKAPRHYRFLDLQMESVVAHGGRGLIQTCRVETRERIGEANFIDMTIVGPGASVGLHSHEASDEEIYVVIAGQGTMVVDGVRFEVGPGDVIVNWPDGTHGLSNFQTEPLKLVVIDIPVAKRN